MAVVWQNSFDGAPGTNITVSNSANYGDAIDGLRNNPPPSAVRYGDRAALGASSMQLGTADGSAHGDVWLFYPSSNEYSLSFYLLLQADSWFRIRDANTVVEFYLSSTSQEYVLGNQVFPTDFADPFIGSWTRVEISTIAARTEYRFYWTDPYAGQEPDFVYDHGRDGGIVNGIFTQGGGSTAYIDNVRIGEGEWLGPWPEYAEVGAQAPVTISGTAEATATEDPISDVSAETELKATASAVPFKASTVSATSDISTATETAASKNTQVSAQTTTDVSAEAVGDPTEEGEVSATTDLDVHADAGTTKHSRTSAVANPEASGIAEVSRSTQAGADGQIEAAAQAGAHKKTSPGAEDDISSYAEAITTKHGVSSAQDSARISVLANTDPEEFLALPVRVRVEIFLPDRSWVDITEDVRVTENITIERGRADEAAEADASSMTLTLNNMHGKYSPRNPNSPYYRLIGRNTPIRVIVDQGDLTMPRFIGEVSEWPPRWDISDTDVWINLEASGILRRLEQGSEEFTSALERYVMSQSPLVYWPLTDGYESHLVATPAVGTSNFGFFVRMSQLGGLTYTQPAWQGASMPPHMEDVVQPRGQRGQASGSVSGATDEEWSVDMVRIGIGGMDSFQAVCSDSGVTQTWFLGEDADLVPREMRVSVATQTEETYDIEVLGTTTSQVLFDDRPHHVRLHCVRSGSNTDWTVYVDGSTFMSGTYSGSLRPLRNIRYEWWVPEEDDFTQFLGFGHVTAWGANAPTPSETFRAMQGWRGELAGVRIARLCAEQNVPLEVNGNLNDTPPSGPQQIEPFLTLIRQAAAVDGGLIHESRTQNAILYRTNRSRYNQDMIFSSEE